MKTILYFIAALLFAVSSQAQDNVITHQRIMVIPFTKDGEDIRTVLDDDVNRRIAITKVKEGFDTKGYTTVDFVGRLKAARDNRVFTSDNQTDIKSKIIEMSGCDIYVVVEVDVRSDDKGASANAILSAYDVATGNSLSNKVGTSGKFFTKDYGKLTTKAVSVCIDDFVDMMSSKFDEMAATGKSVFVDFSFADGSEATMNMPIAKYNNVALSEMLENWLSKNSLNGVYHIQGITDLKMIADEVKIPVVKTNGIGYSPNEFAVEICKFISEMGLEASKEVKSGTIYITIN